MGVKVSKPLATVHGSRLALISSCRLRAVMSTARAAKIRVSLSYRSSVIQGYCTITRDVALRLGFGNIAATFAHDDTKLDYDCMFSSVTIMGTECDDLHSERAPLGGSLRSPRMEGSWSSA